MRNKFENAYINPFASSSIHCLSRYIDVVTNSSVVTAAMYYAIHLQEQTVAVWQKLLFVIVIWTRWQPVKQRFTMSDDNGAVLVKDNTRSLLVVVVVARLKVVSFRLYRVKDASPCLVFARSSFLPPWECCSDYTLLSTKLALKIPWCCSINPQEY